MKRKRLIQVFPKPKWIDTISCDGKPCGGGSGCGSSTTSSGYCKSQACGDSQVCSFEDMLAQFAEVHNDEVELKIADYSSLESIQHSLIDLNKILEANSENLRVTLDNLELVFSQIAPIVAIDGVIAFAKKTPNEEELSEAIGIKTVMV